MGQNIHDTTCASVFSVSLLGQHKTIDKILFDEFREVPFFFRDAMFHNGCRAGGGACRRLGARRFIAAPGAGANVAGADLWIKATQ